MRAWPLKGYKRQLLKTHVYVVYILLFWVLIINIYLLGFFFLFGIAQFLIIQTSVSCSNEWTHQTLYVSVLYCSKSSVFMDTWLWGWRGLSYMNESSSQRRNSLQLTSCRICGAPKSKNNVSELVSHFCLLRAQSTDFDTVILIVHDWLSTWFTWQ